MLRLLLFCLLPLSPLSAQWGANSQPTRTTANHSKRVVGYVTQWDAWKSTDAGLPKQGFLNHLNLDYSQYTHLNFSFFGVANDGSLHSGDYRNPSIYQPGAIQQPAPLLHGDVYSSWDYHMIWGHLVPQWEINATVQAAGFIAHNGGWKHVATGLDGPLPVPFHPPGTAPGILELAHSKGVKVMAAIGGWSMCKHFPEMAADPIKRARFIADCQKLIALGFDGIDFDWEYPGPFAGMNFTGSNADFANFLTLATELRAAIGSAKEITSAMSAAPSKLAGFNWPALSTVLDSIDLMTYDFEGGWSDFAGHNAQLHPHPGQEATTFACSTSVQYLINQGVPRSKIAMGLGFYGRGVVCNGPAALGAPTVKIAKAVQPDGPITTAADFASWEPFDATPTYQRITQLMGSGWTRHWDDVSKVPYLTKGTSFLSYDDSRSIGYKAAYVRDQNLGGVIVWHAFGDLRAGAITNSDKLPFSPTTDAPLINVVNSVFAGDAIPADGTEGPAPTGEPEEPVDPPLDPEAGWTSHAVAGGMTLTLQVTNDWGGGFEGQLLLNNQTGSALNTWTIQFDAPFTVNSMWDGVYGGKNGSTHTATNPTWGGYSLPNNSTGTIGLTASGTKSQPTNLRLNGNSVGSSGTPFVTWASSQGLTSTSKGIGSDGDGRSNLIEVLNGSNPLVPDTNGPRHEIRRLTVNGVMADYFCLVIPADSAAADVEYRVIASATPAMNPARLMVLHGTNTTTPGKLEAVWRDTAPLGPRGFARLEARMKP